MAGLILEGGGMMAEAQGVGGLAVVEGGRGYRLVMILFL